MAPLAQDLDDYQRRPGELLLRWHSRQQVYGVVGPRSGRSLIINRFVGATVFHCHIVAHEDKGMMGIIDITKDGLPSRATQQTLDKINRDMPSHHATHGAGH